MAILTKLRDPAASADKPDRMWLWFVRFSLACAMVPGFGLALAMTGALAAGEPAGLWYPAAVQAHSTALLIGWGGGMILGVALHFLPRLRGVKLARRSWVPWLFGCFAGGLTLRVCGQPLAGWGGGGDFQNVIVEGIFSQAVGVCGLVTVLAITFRSGPPLAKNKGFRQILPLLAVAGASLCLAQIAWCVAAVGTGNAAVLPVRWQQLGADLVLFGFVAAVSVAMSSRLFPLTFRTRLPAPAGLGIAAGLLAAGVVLRVLEMAWAGGFFDIAAPLATAAGLASGTFSVRIFHPRKPGAGMWADPAASGVVCAFVWAVAAALLLIFLALHRAGVPLPAAMADENLARHAAGAGFMTLLIISVGWKMLPGFGGGRPGGRGWLWAAVVLANAATLLRVLPRLVPGELISGRPASLDLLPIAGAAGFLAIASFAASLRLSRKAHPKN